MSNKGEPISGMTGFGRADGALDGWTWAVEARSVNGRNLEARLRPPPGFEALDRTVREATQARFHRGQISITVQAKRIDNAGASRINTEVLDRYLAAGEPYLLRGQALTASLDGLLALRGVIETTEDAGGDPQEQEKVLAAMVASVEAALDALKVSRGIEGAALLPVLTGLVDQIEARVTAAEAEAKTHPALIRERFVRRMGEIVTEGAVGEDRILAEAAVLAARADVREELDRLTAHIAAARSLLSGDGPAGRRLDFLMQEFMREANTLCSKSASSALTAIGLDLKALIEQLREQVQNVE
jgi:uncharacterized protein (TIGR00255 family)